MAGIASLRSMSKTLQAKGRGPDTYLVHMGPEELASMEYLANQRQLSLTVNPETGLYEVGILSSILPMVVGAAAMYFTGGAAAPWVGALAGAGTGALLNKDNRLMGALTGGLGGFAGGSMVGSLGAGAAAEGVGLAGAEAGAQAGSLLGMEGGSGFTGVNALTGGAGGTSAAEAAGMMSSDALGQALQTAQASQAPLVSVPTSGMGPIGAESGYQASSLFVPQPEQSMWGKVGDWWGKKSTMEKVGIGGLGLAGIGAFAEDSNELDEPKKQGGNYQDYEFQPAVYDPETGKSVKPARYVKKGTRAYAGGGLFERGFASGGVAQLSQGRMIKGPGDGLSDSIPASIDGGQQAALADGEFVIPADTVSMLGGGSTDAGARRLYKMLDQVRIAAHGHKRQMQKIPKAALAV